MTDKLADRAEDRAGIRIAKWLAQAGICSRRDAERLIAERRVKIDGALVETPATFVRPEQVISVDGKTIGAPQEEVRLWMYHKPKGQLTTHHDPQGRTTVFSQLPKNLPRVVSVGRLDLNTEGLLLLTNSGALSRAMELPANKMKRTYRVRVFGQLNPQWLDELKRGITLKDPRTGKREHLEPIQAIIERQGEGKQHWISMTVTEGKNREIRRICEALDLQVTRLIRVAYGDFTLGTLPSGEVKEIKGKDTHALCARLGVGNEGNRREISRKTD